MPGIVLGSLYLLAHSFLPDYEASLLDPFIDEQTEVEASNLPAIRQLVNGGICLQNLCV